MKTKKIKYILLITIITIILIMPKAYANTSIEIKPSSTVYTNKTISEFFDDTIFMKRPGEGLEGSDVDVHMATNTDWAIVSYFSHSAYGTNGEGKNTGLDVTIGGTIYQSTNGNITGIMNLGKTYTYTSGIISNFAEIEEGSTVYSDGRRIIESAIKKEYNHVNVVTTTGMVKDMAATGWYGRSIENSINTYTAYPYSGRVGLFSLVCGGGNSSHKNLPDGSASENRTFRPVIWNY